MEIQILQNIVDMFHSSKVEIEDVQKELAQAKQRGDSYKNSLRISYSFNDKLNNELSLYQEAYELLSRFKDALSQQPEELPAMTPSTNCIQLTYPERQERKKNSWKDPAAEYNDADDQDKVSQHSIGSQLSKFS